MAVFIYLFFFYFLPAFFFFIHLINYVNLPTINPILKASLMAMGPSSIPPPNPQVLGMCHYRASSLEQVDSNIFISLKHFELFVLEV